MPFAKNCGGVATLFYEFGKSHFVGADADFGARPKRPVDAEAIWITTGKQSATGSRADGLGDMKIAENATLRRETIQIRSDKTFCAEDTDVRIALVVRENDDYVGKVRASAGRSQCTRVGQEESD